VSGSRGITRPIELLNFYRDIDTGLVSSGVAMQDFAPGGARRACSPKFLRKYNKLTLSQLKRL